MSEKIFGVDVGTGTLLAASKQTEGKMEISHMRNMFLMLDSKDIEASEMSATNLDYVEIIGENDETNFAILGEDAFRFSNIFNREVRRAMANGVLSNKDIDAIDVITKMIENLVGKGDNGTVCFSIPAQAFDIKMSEVSYHEKVFNTIFKSLGFTKIYSINEGLAVIYSECASTNFSGLGISFGSGMTNYCAAWNSLPVVTGAVGRGGDWIDICSGNAINMIPNKVTSMKERKADLDGSRGLSLSKHDKRIVDSISFFYRDLIEYVIENLNDDFEKNRDNLNFDEPISIIISGGTSLIPGFLNCFTSIFNEINKFPFEISEIRHASEPLSTVSKGCLLYALNKASKQ